MKPLYATLRQKGHINAGYIDDIYLQGQTIEACQENVRDTVGLLTEAGFYVHPVKSVFKPKQILVHLGFVLNSRLMTVSLTPEKACKINQAYKIALDSTQMTIQELAELVGKLVASFPGVMYGPLYYRRLDNHKTQALKLACGNYQAKTVLPQECKEDLTWWAYNVDQVCNPILMDPLTFSSPQTPLLQAGEV